MRHYDHIWQIIKLPTKKRKKLTIEVFEYCIQITPEGKTREMLVCLFFQTEAAY